LYVARVFSFCQSVDIIVSYCLRFSTSNGIVMLEKTHGVHHLVLGIKDQLNIRIADLLVNNLLGEEDI